MNRYAIEVHERNVSEPAFVEDILDALLTEGVWFGCTPLPNREGRDEWSVAVAIADRALLDQIIGNLA